MMLSWHCYQNLTKVAQNTTDNSKTFWKYHIVLPIGLILGILELFKKFSTLMEKAYDYLCF